MRLDVLWLEKYLHKNTDREKSVTLIVTEGVQRAMNRINRRVPPPGEDQEAS